jgi:hypothetical protein
MTLTLDLPPQVEQAYLGEAQARGLPLDAVVREALIAAQPARVGGRTVFERGLGLFGSPEDAALLDQSRIRCLRRETPSSMGLLASPV